MKKARSFLGFCKMEEGEREAGESFKGRSLVDFCSVYFGASIVSSFDITFVFYKVNFFFFWLNSTTTLQ